ncbi:hypothetical protein GBA52_018356 [Prunus armeniaca]|nr:hypothetical protein GBA52_018356 [Prunus armeniaca]
MRWTCLNTKYISSSSVLKPTYVTNTNHHFEYQRFQHYGSYQSRAVGDLPNESLPDTLHAKSVKSGSLDNLDVRNYVTSLYVKSNKLDYAHKLFGESPDRDVRSWTILISGFARIGYCRTVLELFKQMQIERVCPNQFTLSSVLKSCSSLSDFRMGKGIHGWILSNGIDLDVVLENSILDVYVKCGAFDYAEKFFETMKERDTVTWNVMMGAYMHTGDMEKALDLFRRLPFKDVASWNTIIYGLMRNGHETYALELLSEMVEIGPPFDKVTFSVALVLASSLYVLELGRQIHGRVLRFGIQNDGFLRTSLIDMYSKCGKMEKASLVFKTLPLRTNSKFTCHETKTEVVSWSSMVSGYVRNEIYSYLDELIGRLKEIGYSLDVKMVMQDVEEEQGEVLLGYHSEKLAIAYGIMSTTSGIPIRIMKNLRVCTDCHNFIKYTSQLLDREIIVRDLHRFHHFKHGLCSCGDYW